MNAFSSSVYSWLARILCPQPRATWNSHTENILVFESTSLGIADESQIFRVDHVISRET